MTHFLSNYTTFTTIEELNSAVQTHRASHCNKLNKTDCAVLELVRKRSEEKLAAHLSHDAFETELHLSNSTIRRTIRKLEALGILRRIHYIRPLVSGLGPNIYVIEPVSEEIESL